jgi:hypothetical protein
VKNNAEVNQLKGQLEILNRYHFSGEEFPWVELYNPDFYRCK